MISIPNIVEQHCFRHFRPTHPSRQVIGLLDIESLDTEPVYLRFFRPIGIANEKPCMNTVRRSQLAREQACIVTDLADRRQETRDHLENFE